VLAQQAAGDAFGRRARARRSRPGKPPIDRCASGAACDAVQPKLHRSDRFEIANATDPELDAGVRDAAAPPSRPELTIAPPARGAAERTRIALDEPRRRPKRRRPSTTCFMSCSDD
jgi:hypothetical protein